MVTMTYRLPSRWTIPLRIAALGLCVVATPTVPRADTGVSLRFVTEGTILPRRGHETLQVESVNLDRLDAAILHVPEGDTLAMLQTLNSPVPATATEVWHGQIAAGDGKTPAPLDQPVQTSLDVLGLVKPLQPGIYIVRVSEVTTGKPRALASKAFVISNIGLQAFSGADGIAVEARLLSEATSAGSIDVALIARNNREIARVRTDGDGIARFNREQVSGPAEDAPAALYAYGAEGEFTILPIDRGALPPMHSPSRAWIVTNKQAYRPGEEIEGLALIAGKNKATPGPIFAQLENAAGEAAEIQDAVGDDGRLLLHAQPGLATGPWTIRVYQRQGNAPILLGSATVRIGVDGPAPDYAAAPQRNTAPDAPAQIVISPGRRAFGRGEIANISVQPDADSDVTIALVDASVRAIKRQHIAKEGAVVQLPIPGDATGGMYVLAVAFAAPQPGKPLRRICGAQWIGIDEGMNRMGVRLDTPEKAESEGKLQVSLALPDIGPGIAREHAWTMLIGTDAGTAASLDPFPFFYGPRPLGVMATDTYADVIGAPEPSLSFASAAGSEPELASALLWDKPHPVPGSETMKLDETMPVLGGEKPRLRLSAIAWQGNRLGYAEVTVGEVPALRLHKPLRLHPARTPAVSIRELAVKPKANVTLRRGEGLVASYDPVVAPVHASASQSFDSVAAELRAFTASLLGPLRDDDTLRDAVAAAGGRGLPEPAVQKLLDGVQAMAAKPDLAVQDGFLSHMVLFQSGRENGLETRHWLEAAPKPDTLLARAARLALGTTLDAAESKTPAAPAPLEAGERDVLAVAIDKDAGDDIDADALALLILARADQPWPSHLAKAISDKVAVRPALSPRAAFALRVAEEVRLARSAPRLEADGKSVAQAVVNGEKGTLEVRNVDSRPLFVWVVSGLPVQE